MASSPSSRRIRRLPSRRNEERGRADVSLCAPNSSLHQLARLSAIYRLPVVLHDALGWTAAEISASMDAGLPATKQRLRRGRMMLVSALAAGDGRRQASLAQPMRCWRARRHVSAYLDRELDAATVSAVEGHVARCPTCPPLYAALVGVRARMEGLRDPDSVVEERNAARVRAHLEEHLHAGSIGSRDHDHAAR